VSSTVLYCTVLHEGTRSRLQTVQYRCSNLGSEERRDSIFTNLSGNEIEESYAHLDGMRDMTKYEVAKGREQQQLEGTQVYRKG